jgi:hypothetical protein
MDYVENLKSYRENRDLFLSHQCVEMFDELINYFFEMEKELVRLIKAFNRKYIWKNVKEKIRCYPKFNCWDEEDIKYLTTPYLTIASAKFKGIKFDTEKCRPFHYPQYIAKSKFICPVLIKQICFEHKTFKNGISNKKYITNGFRWTREITKCVKEKYINTTISNRHSIVKTYRQYKNVAQIINLIGQNLVNYKCKDNLSNTVIFDKASICEHLPERIHATAISRRYALFEMRTLLNNTNSEFALIENKIDKKVKKFNIQHHYDYGGLAFSWELINRQSPILCTKLAFFRINSPLDANGKRSRYKSKIKNLTRDYLRKIKMKRYYKTILADSKKINNLAKEFLGLRKAAHRTHKLLKDFSQSISGIYIAPIDC